MFNVFIPNFTYPTAYMQAFGVLYSIRRHSLTVSRESSNLEIYNIIRKHFPNADLSNLARELNEAAGHFGLAWSKAIWKFTNGYKGQPILHMTYEAPTAHKPFTIDIERSIYKKPHGIVAAHDIFGIPEELQGNDFSRFINGILYRFYKSNGFKFITVEAGLDVGGYVWALAGFAATRKSDLDKIIKEAYKKQSLGKKISLSTIQTLEAEVLAHYSPPTSRPFPIYEWVLYPNIEEIKEILIGTSWHGELNFDDNVQTYTFEKYVNKYQHLNPQ
jgi:hypothetical protein